MKPAIKYFNSFILLSIIIVLQSYADDRYLKCMDALNNKNYAEAIPCLREAARKDKNDPKAFFYLGKALLEADSAEASIPELIKARELDTANVQIYIMLGDAYGKDNIYSVAAENYKKALEYDSLNASIHEKLGNSYMKMRQYTDAATEFRRVFALDTTNLQVVKNLGDLLYRAGLQEQALPFLVWIVNHDPNAKTERLQVVNAMYNSRRYIEMIPYAESALINNSLNDSTSISVTRMLAFSLARAKDFGKAESLYVYLETKDKLSAEEYLELAKAQKALEKSEAAIGSYEKASKLDSTLTAIFYDLGSLYMSKKMYNEAAWAFEKKIATDTTSGYQFASHLNAGLSLMQVKEYKRSLEHIKASLAIRPDYLTGWSSLAACYAQMDSTKQQLEANQKVIDLITSAGDSSIQANKTKLEEAYRVEGFAAFNDKKYERSIESLKKALQLDPKNCQTNVLVAQSYAVLKNNDEAKRYLCKALTMCPKNKDAEKLATFLGITAGDCK